MHVFEISSSVFILVCSILGIIFSLIYIGVLIIDRQCRTMTTLLVFNSIIAGFIVNVVYTCQSIYQLISDKQDNLCEFRGFLLHSTCGLLYHTFCVQALHRLLTTIAALREYLQSKCIIKLAVLIQWLISLTCSLPILLNGQIKFQAGSRVCQVSLTDVYGSIYLAIWIYLLPLPVIVGIYIRIVIYIKQNSFPTIIRQNIFEQQRQQRELRIFRRIIIPVIVLFLMGLPYTVFFLNIHIGHKPAPGYTQRVSLMFVSFGQGISMLLCLINTDDVRKCLINLIRRIKRRRRQRRVQCISVIHPVQIVRVHK